MLVLLPRVPAWYGAMLGAMRIGAVPVPSPNLLTSRDIAYRLRSADAAAIVTDAAGAAKVDAITEELPTLRHRLRWAPGAPPAGGWLDYAALTEQAGDGATPLDPTGRDDPLVIFFTSGTVAYPKMVEQPQSYGLGHVATARFWHDLRPGDLHWTVSDTGWAKAGWGGLFGQWHERATVVQVALGRPDADTILRILAERADHVVLRPADALPAARAGRPRPLRPLGPAPLHERRRAAQPGGDPDLAVGHRR